MKKILFVFVAFAFIFSLVSTNVAFSTQCHGEKAAQAEEGKKDEAAPAESEKAKAAEAAEPEKAEEPAAAEEAESEKAE